MAGRGNARGRGRGGRGRGGFHTPLGPPEQIIEVGSIMHDCPDNQVLCRSVLKDQVPYFNGRIFLENKQEIGKIDEILGPINEFMFSIKLSDLVKAKSFATNTMLYTDAQQVLPLTRFLPKPPGQSKGIAISSRGRGGSRGGRGGFTPRGRGGTPRGRGGASPRGTPFRGRGRSSF